MENFTTIKAYNGKECKKLFISKDMEYTHFLAAMRGMFPKGFNVIRYEDEDKELVTMGSQEEFEEVIKKVAPKLGHVVKVYVDNTDPKPEIDCLPNLGQKDKETIKENETTLNKTSDLNIPAVDKAQDQSKKGSNPFEYYCSLSEFIKEQKVGELKEFLSEEPKVFLPPDGVPSFSDFERVHDKTDFEIVDIEGNLCGEEVKVEESKQIKTKARKVRKKVRRRRRRSSCSSSGSSSDSNTGSSSSSGTSSSDSGSSSSSSESELSSQSDEEDALNLKEHDENAQKKPEDQRIKHRKRAVRMVAKKLTHYIAPDVCDEVAHCMHHIKKDIKRALDVKIAHAIEDNIGRALKDHTLVPVADDIYAEKPAAGRERMFHKNITCDGCEKAIFGPRYKCGNCSDYDLCEDCEAVEGLHDESHVFLKINKPAVNAGRKNGKGKMRPLLRQNIYTFEESEMEKKREVKEDTKKMEELNSSLKRISVTGRKPNAVSALDVITLDKLEKQEIAMEDQNQVQEEYTKKCAVARQPSTEYASKPDFESKSDIESKSDFAKKSEIEAKLTNESRSDSVSVLSKSTEKEHMERRDSNDSVTEDDDVVVVKRGDISESVQKTPDLVEIDAESVSSFGSEDFIVVPKSYEFSSCLNDNVILDRQFKPECTKETAAVTRPNMTMDLLASTIRQIGAKPTIEVVPDITIPEAVAISRSVIEKQPDLDVVEKQPNLEGAMLSQGPPVTAQPNVIARPERFIISSDRTEGTDCATDKEPTGVAKVLVPVTKQPSVEEVQQPEPIIMFGRGAAKQIEEPAKFIIHKNDIISDEPTYDNSQESLADGAAANSETKNDPQSPFNRPSEKFLKQQQEYGNSKLKRPPTWAPDSLHVDNFDDHDVFSSKDLLTETITGIVDATTSAASAMYQGLSSVMAPVNDQGKIYLPPSDTVDGIPRPLSDVPPNSPPLHPTPTTRPAFSANDMLCDMGFYDRSKNEKLLKKYNGDVNRCVAELLSDNNWHSNRH